MSKINYTVVGSKPTSVKIADIIDISSTKFQNNGYDNFDMETMMSLGLKTESCLDICCSTLELKTAIKDHEASRYTIEGKDGELDFIIVKQLQKTEHELTMSLRRFIAICSGHVAKTVIGEVYDWKKFDYKIVEWGTYPVGADRINKLAAKIGISPDSRLYWLYLPGCENLYKWFPIEVVAICSWKIFNPVKSGLVGDEIKLFRSLSSKVFSLDKLDQDKLRYYYQELDNSMNISISEINAIDFSRKMEILFKSTNASRI